MAKKKPPDAETSEGQGQDKKEVTVVSRGAGDGEVSQRLIDMAWHSLLLNSDILKGRLRREASGHTAGQ